MNMWILTIKLPNDVGANRSLANALCKKCMIFLLFHIFFLEPIQWHPIKTRINNNSFLSVLFMCYKMISQYFRWKRISEENWIYKIQIENKKQTNRKNHTLHSTVQSLEKELGEEVWLVWKTVASNILNMHVNIYTVYFQKKTK